MERICEECGAVFAPKPVNYINGFDCDVLCEDCCDRVNEHQFWMNELVRCGG